MINIETLDVDLIEECHDLLLENHAVSGHFESELEIDWSAYLRAGKSFVAFTLRDVNGDLIGILFFVLLKYPHHKNMMMAQQVTFYIKPKFRYFSYVMMQESEQHLKILEVDIIVQSARSGTNFCHTLKSRGYEESDIMYTKIISDKTAHKNKSNDPFDRRKVVGV